MQKNIVRGCEPGAREIRFETGWPSPPKIIAGRDQDGPRLEIFTVRRAAIEPALFSTLVARRVGTSFKASFNTSYTAFTGR